MFRPENAVALPHTTKIQIFSDFRNAAAGNSSEPPAYADPVLRLAIAYATGYGVKSDDSEFRKHATESAENGSTVASLLLACLDDGGRSGHISKAFSDISKTANHEMCKTYREMSECVDLNPLNSADGCNPLHYLSLLETSRTGSVSIKQVSSDFMPDSKSEGKVKNLRLIISQIKTGQLNGCTSSVHYIHPHFPLCLEGTPLSFAVHLGCYESVETLLLEGAHPLEPVMRPINNDRSASKLQPKLTSNSALHTAVACHRPLIYKKLWFTLASSGSGSRCMSDEDEVYDIVAKRNWIGANIVSALGQQSLLEEPYSMVERYKPLRQT